MIQVLVIDDDPLNRDILKARLEAAGYGVLEAGDGEQGLTAAAESRPDLIVLDVMMPRMDGWRLCRALKRDPATGAIPVVMLTALSSGIDELRGFESGADEYLAKPCDHRVLLETVARLAGGKP